MVSVSQDFLLSQNAAWTTDRVFALAPDPASAKNGKGLAILNKWSNLGKDQQIIWGECAGSGKEPYRIQIELSEPAFRCSCPSRKFPCKHGLGLLFLMVSQPGVLANETPPEWVADWIASRTKREENQKQKLNQPEKAADPEAQLKRAKARMNKVRDGVADLQIWLHDLIRHGLAALNTESYSFWEQPAARMIDFQAPGLARYLREISSISASGTGWQERLVSKLGKLHLLLEGFQRLDHLHLGLQADIRSQIGWTQNQAQLAEGGNEKDSNHLVSDIWLVMGQQLETEERLRISRTWLWGKSSDRYGLYLQFAYGNQAFEHSFSLGNLLEAELAFFDSSYPDRAIITNRQNSLSLISSSDRKGSETIDLAIAAYSKALTANPWLERFPLTLQQVIPIHREDKWFVRDRNGNLLKISSRFENNWRLLALSGGHPLTIFGEWNGNDFYPISIWLEQQFYGA